MTKALVLLPILLLLPNNGGPRPHTLDPGQTRSAAACRPPETSGTAAAPPASLSLSLWSVDWFASFWVEEKTTAAVKVGTGAEASGRRRGNGEDDAWARETRGPTASVPHRGAGFTEVCAGGEREWLRVVLFNFVLLGWFDCLNGGRGLYMEWKRSEIFIKRGLLEHGIPIQQDNFINLIFHL